MTLEELAQRVGSVIARAEAAGVAVDDGNVVDLLADNLTSASLADIRAALVVAGFAARFPRATARQGPARAAPSLEVSAGAVVVDASGLNVMLRLPKQAPGYEGGWTHAKGRPNADEDLKTAAQREVLEEMGASVQVLRQLPGNWQGEFTTTTYFLARFTGLVAPFDAETEAVRWVRWDEAAQMIAASGSGLSVARDLAVLSLARAFLAPTTLTFARPEDPGWWMEER